MKRIINLILLLSIALLLFSISCSPDDKIPPTAGFKLNPETPIQGDVTLIISTAVEAAETSYSVAGGEYEMNLSNTSIKFLEGNQYTVIQTVTNEDGTDQYTLIVDVTPLNPPIAGFTLNPEIPIQDQVTNIISSAVGATQTSYSATGGTYEIDNANSTIKFLEAQAYTITQTVVNQDGKDEYSITVDVKAFNPPIAGFTMSEMEPLKWGTSNIISTAENVGEINYEVSGGEFVWVDVATIQFLEDHSYTITQIVTNDDGEDSTSLTINIEAPANTYIIDATEYPITSAPIWVPANEAHETKALLHFIADVEGQDEPNHIKLSPILGPNALEGTYTYNSDKETIGTYYTRVIANFSGDVFDPSDWTTAFAGEDGGSDLVIELIYEDTENADNNAYEFTITSYMLSTGYFDWNTFSFVEEAKRPFTLSYRGVVIPVVGP